MKEAVFNISRLTRLRPPRISRQAAGRAAAVLLILLLGWGMFYQVGPDEAGVVTRFGRFVRTAGPGLRVKLPLVASATTVPVQRQLRQQFGFRTQPNGRRAARNFADESMRMTGDLNVVVVEWIVQYRIADPYVYLFKFRDTDRLFGDMT